MFGSNIAVIVIDMEKAFVQPGAAFCIKGAKATVGPCAATIDLAREEGSPIFWVKRIYREDGSDVEHSRYDKWLEAGKPLTPNSTGLNSIEEADGLERKEEDYVIIKNRWSAFFQTELDMMLRRLGIDTVVLLGTTTPNCIRTTCYDAIALDYKVIIMGKCCSSNTEEIQRVNMEDMERAGAEIIW